MRGYAAVEEPKHSRAHSTEFHLISDAERGTGTMPNLGLSCSSSSSEVQPLEGSFGFACLPFCGRWTKKTLTSSSISDDDIASQEIEEELSVFFLHLPEKGGHAKPKDPSKEGWTSEELLEHESSPRFGIVPVPRPASEMTRYIVARALLA